MIVKTPEELTLHEIMEQWEKDCTIDQLQLDKCSRETPKLHARYLRTYTEQKLNLYKLEEAEKVILKDKWLYYQGKMSQERMEQLGWKPDPFDGLRVLQKDMEHYYNTDEDIKEFELQIATCKITVDTLREIVDSLKWRHQTIGNMIRWRAFEAGN
jgi:hypothetical protein